MSPGRPPRPAVPVRAAGVASASASASGQTLFSPNEGRRALVSGLPADVLAQSARRLYALAILYAIVFFLAAYFPAFWSAQDRASLLSNPWNWVPGLVAIAIALGVAVLTRLPGVPLDRVMLVGLGFEVVSSFGIALAEYSDVGSMDFSRPMHFGLSWVAVWVMLFAMAVPSTPRRTLFAALASVSSVPIVTTIFVGERGWRELQLLHWFFGLVFPYLLVTAMAVVGARVLYALGREVTRARELGGYRLVERLGVGGMGEVWRAEHRLLVRPAAIKLVRPEILGTPGSAEQRQAEERFEREAQATASLRSPHTVELYDFGVASDGTLYYVMELLEGFDLQTLVDRFGPVPAERAVGLLRQVCRSLGEAHESGLVHRDIKPANVYVCRYGRQVEFVKVLDFGMVKTRHEPAADAIPLTGESTILGTPAFMAPEVILGRGTVDGRADLYAVGCLAYWLLTGQMVFTGKTPMEVLVQHVRSEPVPPSARTAQRVPAALDAVVLACLAKDPADRPASADALAEVLASIETSQPWTAARAREWWEAHPSVRDEIAVAVSADGITQESPRLG